jgi:hypothetical protein
VRGQLLFKNIAAGELLLNARASRSDQRAGGWEQYATNPGADGYNQLAGNANIRGNGPGANASGIPNSPDYTTTNNRAGYARIKTSGMSLKYTKDFSGTTFNGIVDYSKLKKEYQEDLTCRRTRFSNSSMVATSFRSQSNCVSMAGTSSCNGRPVFTDSRLMAIITKAGKAHIWGKGICRSVADRWMR